MAGMRIPTIDKLIEIIFNLSIFSISLYRYTGKRVDNIEGAMLLLVISNVLLQVYFLEYLVAFSIINVGTKLLLKL
jgi:hypothetical protein